MLRTKIVCTLGPAVGTSEAILGLIERGMSVARLNLSHADLETHRKKVHQLKAINAELAKRPRGPHCVAIMLDTKGPEVRTGTVEKPIEIRNGQEVIFSTKPIAGATQQVILIDHKHFAKDVKDAESILLDNGTMRFELLSIRKDGTVLARSRDDGSIGSRRHVNLPGANLTIPSITDKDWEDIAMGAEEDVDFIALSFVREAKDVQQVRAFLKKKRKSIGLISKIETRQAVDNMREIIAASDGIMVARGDLGAEVDFEKIPVIQDELVSLTREAGKPVIVATHMLESMIENPMPTRAEVTDIAHAAMIGTDATMLSGETAGGKYPFASLEAMARVLRATEKHLETMQPRLTIDAPTKRAAQADAAVSLAISMDARAIIVMTRSGLTARQIARYRPHMPLIACTPDASIQRTLGLSYGVVPVCINFSKDPEKTVHDALAVIKELKLLKKGDQFILVSDAKAHAMNVSSIQMRQVP
jgi:pyruvate kinase